MKSLINAHLPAINRLLVSFIENRKKKPQISPLRYPGFPVGIGGVGELHAAFLNESRTRGHVQRCVAGNPGQVGMTRKG
jgi:hypothetical protein